jgi:hypothetical protein
MCIECITWWTVRSPAGNPQFKTEKTFKAWVVLINRGEHADRRYAPSPNGFRTLADEGVSTNPVARSEAVANAAAHPRIPSPRQPPSAWPPFSAATLQHGHLARAAWSSH